MGEAGKVGAAGAVYIHIPSRVVAAATYVALPYFSPNCAGYRLRQMILGDADVVVARVTGGGHAGD